MRLFLDMDGVLADFDRHYEELFGVRPDKATDNVDWSLVNAVPDFFDGIPPMEDMTELWDFARRYSPTILTGVPASVGVAADNKRRWIARHLGPDVPVIPTRSRRKAEHAGPDAVLVDDWEKYRHLWIATGGIWITHTSAAASIAALEEVL